MEIVDTGSDLNAYAKVEPQSGCCCSSPSLPVVEPAAAGCCSPAPSDRQEDSLPQRDDRSVRTL